MIFMLLVAAVVDLWRPIRTLWSAPRRYGYGYGYYNYFWTGVSASCEPDDPIQPPHIASPTMAPAE
jgi:hypothetical protein